MGCYQVCQHSIYQYLFLAYLYLAPVAAGPSTKTPPCFFGTVKEYRNEALLLFWLCLISSLPTWIEVRFMMVIDKHVFWSQMLLSVTIRSLIAYLSAWDVFLQSTLWHWPSDLWSTMRYNSRAANGRWTAGYFSTVVTAIFYNVVWLVGWFLFTVITNFGTL